MARTMTIGFIGNPNSGKTTLFNAYTGANLKVANWPGVTVERVEGALRAHDLDIRLVDLPGTYSLTSYTMEEQVSRQFILGDDVDVIVDVVDATNLERSLYLTLQLIELGKPVVMALNMMDLADQRGLEIDLHRLPEMLGIPVVPVSAKKKTGLNVLIHAAAHHLGRTRPDPLVHNHAPQNERERERHAKQTMVYSEAIETKIDALVRQLRERYPTRPHPRWHAIKLLEGDREIGERVPVDAPAILDRSYESEIIAEKYGLIEEIVKETVLRRAPHDAADRIDRVLTHRWLGIPIFLLTMALVFFFTFTVGDWLKGYVEDALAWFSDTVAQGLEARGVWDWAASLIVDGAIAGVGAVLTFLPNIVILFFALAILEDSGYMARVAYVMEGVMGRMGLSGRAFIPMVLGFGCTVPAIMASRSLENPRDRFKVMLITPFMSCSAKLPIYVLFAGLFFPDAAMWVAYSMYLIGMAVALIVAFVFHRLERPGVRHPLLIELPDYKWPTPMSLGLFVYQKGKDYVVRAGTIIFAVSILMWFLLNFGSAGFSPEIADSFGAALGKGLVPFLKPVGLGFWPIGVALIAGLSAKEMVVSTCAILFGLSTLDGEAGQAAMTEALSAMGFGPLNAFCLMVFCLLYVPCLASLAVIRRETRSWKTMFLMGAFQIAVAWLAAFLLYQIGSRL